VSWLLPLVLFVVIPAALAQDEGNDQAPQIPTTQNAGADLIAWSEMQTPEPVPAQTAPATPAQAQSPEPRPETPAPQTSPATPGQGTQPEQLPGQAGSQQPQGPDNNQAEPAAQTFTGTISKEGDSYVLKVADTTSYKLDDQDKAKEFENQKVRVIGTVDKSADMIHVQKIEPLS
jgi:outer membrane biosynthesis protein TonB